MRPLPLFPLLFVLSCADAVPSGAKTAEHASTSAPSPASTATVAQAPGADVSPSPAPSASPAPAAPSAECEPRERVEVPGLIGPMFERGRHFRYSVTDDVDPHAPTGKRDVTKTKVDCVVSSICQFHGGAIASELACTTDPSGPSSVAPDRLGFLTQAGSLWMTPAPVSDEAIARKTMTEAALLPPTPAKSRRTYDQPGMNDGDRDTCTDVLEVTSALVCRDVRCAVKVGYGPSQERTCVSPNRGLATWRRVNLAGPRTTTWELVDSRPAAPH